MVRTVRIGKLNDQDDFRRDDIRKMSPADRVHSVVELQYNYLRWDLNPSIERVGKLKKVNFCDVT